MQGRGTERGGPREGGFPQGHCSDEWIQRMKRLTDSAFDQEEDEKEFSLRPKTLKDFQGQEEIKSNLAVFIQAAKERKESIDHIFLSGPPGLGKTTLAGIVASEMGAEFKVTSVTRTGKTEGLGWNSHHPGSWFGILHR